MTRRCYYATWRKRTSSDLGIGMIPEGYCGVNGNCPTCAPVHLAHGRRLVWMRAPGIRATHQTHDGLVHGARWHRFGRSALCGSPARVADPPPLNRVSCPLCMAHAAFADACRLHGWHDLPLRVVQ